MSALSVHFGFGHHHKWLSHNYIKVLWEILDAALVFHCTEFQGSSQNKLGSPFRHEACPLLLVQNDIITLHACLFFFLFFSSSLFFPHQAVRAGLSCFGCPSVCMMVINGMHEFLTACSSIQDCGHVTHL